MGFLKFWMLKFVCAFWIGHKIACGINSQFTIVDVDIEWLWNEKHFVLLYLFLNVCARFWRFFSPFFFYFFLFTLDSIRSIELTLGNADSM